GAPILARPVSRRERFWRWCKRNPVVSSLSAALSVALVVGFVGITWQWIRAEKETDRAIQQEQLTRRYLYSAHMKLAHEAWNSGNVLRVHELLNRHKPRAGEEDLRSFDWYYLWRQCHRDRKTIRLDVDGNRLLNIHSDDAVAVSPSGRFVAIGGRNYGAEPDVGEVRLWDVAAKRVVRVFRGKETREIHSLVFSPDTTTLAAHAFGPSGGSADQQIIVWNVETGEQLATLDLGGRWFRPSSPRPPYSLSSGGRLLAAIGAWAIGDWKASEDEPGKRSIETIRGVKLWEIPAPHEGTKPANGQDASSAKPVKFKFLETGGMHVSRELLLSPDGKWLAWGRGGPTPVLSDLTSEAEPIVLDAFQVFAFSPDSRWVLALRHDRETNDTVLEIRECATGQLHRAFEADIGDIRRLAARAAFSPDSRVLAFSNGEFVGLWDVESGEKLVTLKGHTSDVASVAFSQDGRSVISVARTRLEQNRPYEAKVWDVDTRYDPGQFVANENGMSALAASPAGDLLATASNEGVRIWDLSSNNFDQPLLVLRDKTNPQLHVERLAFGPQGKLLVASGKSDVGRGGLTDHLRLWRLSRKEQGFHAELLDSLYTPRITSEDNNPVVSPDGRLVAYVGRTFTPNGNGRGGSHGPQTLRLLDVTSGKERQIPRD
ncbi:MAG: hypothetical protein FJ276_35550, partial [Planctomycetes bacterium]|nr:hypothetical protein [Planctomycetota bacterium]